MRLAIASGQCGQATVALLGWCTYLVCIFLNEAVFAGFERLFVLASQHHPHGQRRPSTLP